jgi:SMODS and SLOG-associating 2TM effector domain 1
LTAQPEASPGLADEPSARHAWGQGRIPLHLRAGVTGHRSIDPDDPALLKAVRDALQLIRSRCRLGTASTTISLTVVSALAEGADRVVAQEAIGCGASLEVVLPLPADEYLTDFDSATSRSEFRTLLDQASAVTELPDVGGRDAAYERAGRAIVDRSDVLLALWDGRAARGRGGTAHIVSYARRHGVPVLQIAVERLDPGSPHPHTIIHEPKLPEFFGLLSDTAFKRLDLFNSGTPRPGRKGKRSLLLPAELATPVPPRVTNFVNYARPYFSRAEQIAGSSQRLFIRLTRLLYSLAAAAVILVATQIIFFGRDPQIVWAEVVALTAVVVTLILGRRARWHDRWLAARYLAERIRSGVFLAAVGGGNDLRTAAGGMPRARSDQSDPRQNREERAGLVLGRWVHDRRASARYRARRIGAVVFPFGGDDDRQPGAGRLQRPDSVPPDANREWVERAFREIYWSARRSSPGESELPALRDLLIEAWIDDQVGYHNGVSGRLFRRQRQLSWLVVTLFTVSALVAFFHTMDLFQSASGPDVWGYCSVVIPAVGAAISGYSAQREYSRLAERSRMMASRLSELRDQIEHAGQLSSLQRMANTTELLMRSETAEWYEVVRLHDLEVPS